MVLSETGEEVLTILGKIGLCVVPKKKKKEKKNPPKERERKPAGQPDSIG